MACITHSWNNSAAHRVPYNAFFNSTRLHGNLRLLSGNHPNVLIQQSMVECYRQVVETTQSASPTSAQRGCEAPHQSSATHNARVPVKQSVRVSHAISAWLQVWISQRPIRPRFACSHPTTSRLLGASALSHTIHATANSHVVCATFVFDEMSEDFSTGKRCIHQHGHHCCLHQHVRPCAIDDQRSYPALVRHVHFWVLSHDIHFKVFDLPLGSTRCWGTTACAELCMRGCGTLSRLQLRHLRSLSALPSLPAHLSLAPVHNPGFTIRSCTCLSFPRQTFFQPFSALVSACATPSSVLHPAVGPSLFTAPRVKYTCCSACTVGKKRSFGSDGVQATCAKKALDPGCARLSTTSCPSRVLSLISWETSGSGLARGTELFPPARRSRLRTHVLAVFCAVSNHLPRWWFE